MKLRLWGQNGKRIDLLELGQTGTSAATVTQRFIIEHSEELFEDYGVAHRL